MNAEEIFAEALDKAAGAERSAYVVEACAGNLALQEDVESLLEAHESLGGFLDQPFVDLALDRIGGENTNPVPDLNGTFIGRFEFVRHIGTGGMGEVYLARDQQLGREVAVKLLPLNRTVSESWLARFQREARAASAVNHPNILTIYDIGESNGRHFIATEHIEGWTLRAYMAQNSLSLQQVLEIAVQITSALSAAHAANVIHRDLKPENIMVRADGLIKILDFGLAKQVGLSADFLNAAVEHPAAQISATGSISGTLHYMSPEQARGHAVDAGSDIFSFGVVLFELLMGCVPFRGNTPADVLVSILHSEAEPVDRRRFEVSTALQQIVASALCKDPAGRIRDMRTIHLELKHELQALERRLDQTSALSNTALSEATLANAAQVTAENSAARGLSNQRTDASTQYIIPEVRYACSGEVNIAYQVFGSGDIDLVFVMGWVSHLDWFWKEPGFAAFLRRLGSFARVILFDKRGTGLSDRVPVDQLPTLELRMDDLRTVMDAVASQRAVLLGISEGGPMCALFAATFPEKTIALIMIGSYARRLWSEDYPWGVHEQDRTQFLEEIRRGWGGPVGIEDRAPSLASNEAFREWWATYLRMGASPGAAVALTRMNAQIDVRPILPLIRVPSLIIHRVKDRCLRVEEGRYLAECIPGARFVELPGADHLPFVGDQSSILDNIEQFVSSVSPTSIGHRVLATIVAGEYTLDSSIQGSDQDLEERVKHLWSHAIRNVGLFRGENFSSAGQSFFAMFDGPTRAIRAAMAMRESAYRHGLRLRVGLHIGECDVVENSFAGQALELAKSISRCAASNQILVSGTVKDLVAGSGLSFVEQEPPAGSLAICQLKLFLAEP